MHPTKDVYAKEASQLIQAGTKVLDVRTPEEFANGHIQGAVNVPFMVRSQGGMEPNPNFIKGVKTAFPDSSEPFVVHCQSGARSRRACNELTKDYSKIIHMEGGFGGWASEGLPSTR